MIFPFVTSTMNVPFVRSLELSIAWRNEKFTDTDLFATDPTLREATFDNVNDRGRFWRNATCLASLSADCGHDPARQLGPIIPVSPPG